MVNWLVSVGTGPNQISLIRAAKKLGYKVIGIDQKPNEFVIDKSIPISTYDWQTARDYVLEMSATYDIKGIFSRVSGPAVKMQNVLAGALSLPSSGSKIAAMSIAKNTLKEEAQKVNVNTINGIKSCRKTWSEPKYPSVVKPNEPLFGKQNVYLVKNFSECERAVHLAAGESFDNSVVIQEFIPGEDIGILCAFHAGEIMWHFVYSEHVAVKDGKFEGRGVSFSTKNSKHAKKGIEAISAITANLNIYGFVFFCFRITKGEDLMIYEINPGLSGDGIVDELLPKLWPTFNFYEAEVRLCMAELPLFPNSSEGIVNEK